MAALEAGDDAAAGLAAWRLSDVEASRPVLGPNTCHHSTLHSPRHGCRPQVLRALPSEQVRRPCTLPAVWSVWLTRGSLGGALTDTLDNLITERRIEPQLAMKILTNFDKAVADVLADKVKSRLTFKVGTPHATTGPLTLTVHAQGHLDTYRFCDDVWTFIIKDITFKLDNTNQVHADRVKIVSCNTKRPGEI
jgi:transcription initiation factor TFIIA small subunit